MPPAAIRNPGVQRHAREMVLAAMQTRGLQAADPLRRVLDLEGQVKWGAGVAVVVFAVICYWLWTSRWIDR